MTAPPPAPAVFAPPLALVRIEGPDAAAFLNGQFTCDVAALRSGEWTWGGYCSPKGRLLAVFRLGCVDGIYLLQAPAAVASDLVGRLKRYVLRARVGFTCLATRHLAGSPDALAMSDPPPARTLRCDGDLVVWGLAGGVIALDAPGERNEPSPSDWTLEVLLGSPWILPVNTEAFVPQMAALDRIGGVSFDKGCYPGQEVVARARYLGEVKRHLFRLGLSEGPLPAPGDPVMAAGRTSGAVLVAGTSDSGTLLLAVVEGSAAGGSDLSVAGRPVLRLEAVHAEP